MNPRGPVELMIVFVKRRGLWFMRGRIPWLAGTPDEYFWNPGGRARRDSVVAEVAQCRAHLDRTAALNAKDRIERKRLRAKERTQV